jgi:hypothetical protein
LNHYDSTAPIRAFGTSLLESSMEMAGDKFLNMR